MTDLVTLGHELRTRRRALRIPRAELARRIEASPTYVWLIENARPRPSGEPSRPREDLLERWTAALGMDHAETRAILELAGHFESRPSYDAPVMSPPPPAAMPMPEGPAPYQRSPSLAAGTAPEASSRLFTSPMQALRRWSGAVQQEDETTEEPLATRMQEILQQAERQGKGDEAAGLLESFLRWLEFHLKE